jgi:hypothetical protein
VHALIKWGEKIEDATAEEDEEIGKQEYGDSPTLF